MYCSCQLKNITLQNEIKGRRTMGTYCCSEAVFEAATQRSAGDFPAVYWINRV